LLSILDKYNKKTMKYSSGKSRQKEEINNCQESTTSISKQKNS